MNKALTIDFPFIIRYSFLFWGKIILRTFLVLSVISILGLLVFYIFQVNSEISKRYLIQNYEKRLDELLKENKNLEIESVRMKSLENVLVSLEKFNFEKIDKIHYIRVLDAQVVHK